MLGATSTRRAAVQEEEEIDGAQHKTAAEQEIEEVVHLFQSSVRRSRAAAG